MFLALLFGSIVGAFLGLLGGGGTMLAVPLLAYGISLEPKEAIATSLVVVGFAALAGAGKHWRQGSIDLRIALTFGLFGSIGSAAGAQLARLLPPGIQMSLFAFSVIVAAILLLRGGPSQESSIPASTVLKFQPIAAALGAGLLTGLVGIGGGFVVIPILVCIVGLPMRRAIGTSLLVLVFNAFGGVASYASYVSVTPSVLIPFTTGAVIASVASTTLGRHVGETTLRLAFAISLLCVGIFTIAKEGFVIWAS